MAAAICSNSFRGYLFEKEFSAVRGHLYSKRKLSRPLLNSSEGESGRNEKSLFTGYILILS